MEYMYAAMLLYSAKKPITEESVTAILNAAGVTADGIRVKALCAALAEVNIEEALKAPVFATAAATPAAEVKKEEAKPAEKPKEEKKEEDLQGLGALFG